VLTVVEVLVSTLSTKDEESTDDEVCNNRCGPGPPDKGIAYEVNLTMILDPEVLASRLVSVQLQLGRSQGGLTMPRLKPGH
jgi:hypothetical protein